MCHWSACFHFMVASIQDFPENSWVTREGLQNRSMIRQYTTCMFRSLCHMTTLNYGSRGVPKGITDLWVDIISMMVGTVMYTLVLARITALVTHSRVSENVYKSKCDELCQYMRLYRIPGALRERAICHLASRYQGKWFDEKAILMELNEPLRREIISYNCSNLIKKHPVFKDANPLYLLELLDKLEFECYQPGELIIGRGTMGDCMYFIDKGDVEVDSRGYTQILSDGSFFGELCVMTDITRRQADVRALTSCRLYSLSISNYEHVSKLFPKAMHGMETQAQQLLQDLKTIIE
ncbi:potassium/sodium hyperpolarization-activated cyclic nucleotide-gated channel 2-like isoform X2 [Clupea harengus]|nr:potassium/sodium hyperpolarization-activated cyclic nucleotide-gated channel 2-like isoform X2 [Clupea harengus]